MDSEEIEVNDIVPVIENNELVDVVELAIFIENEDGIFQNINEDKTQNIPDELNEKDDIPLCVCFHNEIGFDWKRNYRRPHNSFKFSNKSGPTVPDDIGTPIEYFSTLLPDTLIEKIAFETNLYCS